MIELDLVTITLHISDINETKKLEIYKQTQDLNYLRETRPWWLRDLILNFNSLPEITGMGAKNV